MNLNAPLIEANVISALMNASVLEIAQLMGENRVSCIVITEENREKNSQAVARNPVGIITERDIMRFQGLQMNLEKLSAHHVMSSPLFLLSQDSRLSAHQEMQRRQVGRLVVSWNWKGWEL